MTYLYSHNIFITDNLSIVRGCPSWQIHDISYLHMSFCLPISPHHPLTNDSLAETTAKLNQWRGSLVFLSSMEGLRVLNLSLEPEECMQGGYVRITHQFNDKEQDIIFEAIRNLVEKRPGVVTLELPLSWQNLLHNIQVRWRKSFGLLYNDPWEKLHCKHGHNDYLLNILPLEIRQQIWSEVLGGHTFRPCYSHAVKRFFRQKCGGLFSGPCLEESRCGKIYCKRDQTHLLDLLLTCKQM